MKAKRKATAEAVEQAAQAWKGAPIHIRTMAGAYVTPLLGAIFAINEELQRQRDISDMLLEQARPLMGNLHPDALEWFKETAKKMGEEL